MSIIAYIWGQGHKGGQGHFLGHTYTVLFLDYALPA